MLSSRNRVPAGRALGNVLVMVMVMVLVMVMVMVMVPPVVSIISTHRFGRKFVLPREIRYAMTRDAIDEAMQHTTHLFYRSHLGRHARSERW